MGRKHVALQRRVARVLGGWRDPHDTKPYPELDIVQHVDIAEDGEVNLTVRTCSPALPVLPPGFGGAAKAPAGRERGVLCSHPSG